MRFSSGFATLCTVAAVYAIDVDVVPRAANLTAVCSQIAQRISSASAVFYPGSAEYDAAIKHWYTSSSDASACAVEPATTRDLGKILDIIGRYKVPFAVKGAGHIQQPGYSSTKGVHIAMRRFNEITYNTTAPLGYKSFAPLGAVTIGMGLKWNEVYEYLNPRNITVAGGRVTGVGVGGFTLGGGYSWQANQVGMTVDTILKFEIVLTSGEVKTVTATSDPSGNNFGIVTRVTLKALPYNGVYGGIIDFSQRKDEVFNAVLEFEKTVTDPKANIIICINYMNGAPDISVVLYYDGPTPPAGIFDGLLAIPHNVLAPPISRSLVDMTTVTSQDAFGGPLAFGQHNTVTVYRNTLEYLNAVWDECSKHGSGLRASSSGFSTVYTVEPLMRDYLTRPQRTSDSAFPPTSGRSYGGQPTLVSFSWLNATGSDMNRMMLHQTGSYLQGLQTAIANGTNLGLYPNYAMMDNSLESVYTADGVARLKRVAKRVDPQGIMKLAGGFKV